MTTLAELQAKIRGHFGVDAPEVAAPEAPHGAANVEIAPDPAVALRAHVDVRGSFDRADGGAARAAIRTHSGVSYLSVERTGADGVVKFSVGFSAGELDALGRAVASARNVMLGNPKHDAPDPLLTGARR